MTLRGQLIQQMREALYQLESPETEVAEFEIADIGFCFESDNLDEEVDE